MFFASLSILLVFVPSDRSLKCLLVLAPLLLVSFLVAIAEPSSGGLNLVSECSELALFVERRISSELKDFFHLARFV